MSNNDYRDKQTIDWHGHDADAVIERLRSDRHRGLSSQEARQRLKRFGRNRLPPPRRRPGWLRFLLQFHNVRIYVMLVAGATTAMLGNWVDTGVLLSAVFVNAIIGFIQEGKAEKALDAIRGMLSLRTIVIHDAERIEIRAEDLVPADLRLIAAKGLRVSEAILTGESEAVEKTVAPVPMDSPLGDRTCILYSGTLGSVTVICSDKTGTLTRNEMTVQRVITSDHIFEVTGVGYAPDGGIHLGREAVPPDQYPELAEIAGAAVLCNDAQLRKSADETWRVAGDPTEGALLAFAMKVGIDPWWERDSSPSTDAIPLESEHRLMAALNHDHEGRGTIYVKGAPERVFEMCGCRGCVQEALLDLEYWRRAAADADADGLRVLAIAAKPAEETQCGVQFSDLKNGFRLLDLVGIMDPPRDEAVAAVAARRTAGIRVKMITGDHVETARAIGAQLGIGRNRPALAGAEIESTDDARLRDAVLDVDVFARASPEHKLRLVQALQAAGQVVAMTGEGVNDAPALKRADVAVAMGLKGTEAAKEAADMVLADDNFATIGNAVREGRGIYDNIRKFVLFMLPTNGGEALAVIAAILYELALLLIPAQVLWINMVTSSTLGLALALERPEHDVIRRPPRDPKESLHRCWKGRFSGCSTAC